MAALTWRDVAAPDLSTSLQGYQQFSQLLNGALGTAKSTINQIDGNHSERVNNLIMAQVAQAKSPEEAEALVGQVLADPNNVQRISGESRNALTNRAGQLLNEDITKYNWKNKVEDDQTDDQVNALGAQIQMLNNQNTPEGRSKAQELIAANAGLLGKVDLGTQAKLLGNGDDWQKSRAGLESTLRANDQGAFEYKNQLKTFERNEEAQNIVAQIHQNPDIQTREAAVEALRAKGITDGTLYNATLAGITGMYQGNESDYSSASIVLDPDLLPTGGGNGGAGRAYRQGSAYNTVLGDGKYGLPSKPVSEMTMGEAYAFGRNTLTPATKAAKVGRLKDGTIVGSTALGAYQFVGQTMKALAQEMYGDKWSTMTFSPKVQDEMAERLFNQNKNGNLQDTWEGLPNRTKGAYANKSWAEMKQIINKYEIGDSGGGSQASTAGKAASAITGVLSDGDYNGLKAGFVNIEGRDGANATLRSFAPLTSKDSSSTAEAQALFKEYDKIPVQKYRDAIEFVSKNYKVTNAVAARIVARSRSVDKGIALVGPTGSLASVLPSSLVNKGEFISMDRVRKEAKIFGGNGSRAIEQAVKIGNVGSYKEALDGALQQSVVSRQRLRQALLAKQKNPRVDISAVEAEDAQAQRNLTAAAQKAEQIIAQYSRKR